MEGLSVSLTGRENLAFVLLIEMQLLNYDFFHEAICSNDVTVRQNNRQYWGIIKVAFPSFSPLAAILSYRCPNRTVDVNKWDIVEFL